MRNPQLYVSGKRPMLELDLIIAFDQTVSKTFQLAKLSHTSDIQVDDLDKLYLAIFFEYSFGIIIIKMLPYINCNTFAISL